MNLDAEPRQDAPGAPPEGAELAPPLEPAKPRRGRPPGSKSAPKAPKEAAPEPPDRDQVAAAWRGLFFVVKILAGWFGFEAVEMDENGHLPEAEAKEDAKTLRLIPGLHRLTFLSWVAAPVIVLQRLTQHFKRRKPAAPVAVQAPPVQAPAVQGAPPPNGVPVPQAAADLPPPPVGVIGAVPRA